MPNANPEELLTATQVGTMISRSSRTVIRAAEESEIPISAKLPGPNGAYLFRRADAEQYAEDFAAKQAAKDAKRAAKSDAEQPA